MCSRHWFWSLELRSKAYRFFDPNANIFGETLNSKYDGSYALMYCGPAFIKYTFSSQSWPVSLLYAAGASWLSLVHFMPSPLVYTSINYNAVGFPWNFLQIQVAEHGEGNKVPSFGSLDNKKMIQPNGSVHRISSCWKLTQMIVQLLVFLIIHRQQITKPKKTLH